MAQLETVVQFTSGTTGNSRATYQWDKKKQQYNLPTQNSCAIYKRHSRKQLRNVPVAQRETA